MNGPELYLKKSKTGLTHSKHPWIFDGAIDLQKSGPLPTGTATLLTHDGRFAAVGTYNPKSAIAFRVFDVQPVSIDAALFAKRFERAKALREAIIDEETDGYRLVNSEGDELPGLTVDHLAGHLVVQVGTPAMDALAPVWLNALRQVFTPESVTRKDSQSVANREHMTAVAAVLFGEPPETVHMREAGVRFVAQVISGQKTGFFLDQRENRCRIARLARDRRVLDGYAYTGGFGAHALAAGASSVTGVETSKPACGMMAVNYLANNVGHRHFDVICADCARYLKETDQLFDIVVLDPPALAQRRQHLPRASRLYQEIFAGGMRCISSDGGFLMACSCSAAVNTETLLAIVRQAAVDAGRRAQVVHVGGAAADHPVSLFHPEGAYLKSVLLRIA